MVISYVCLVPVRLLLSNMVVQQGRIQDIFQEGVHSSLALLQHQQTTQCFFFAECQLYQKTAGHRRGCAPPPCTLPLDPPLCRWSSVPLEWQVTKQGHPTMFENTFQAIQSTFRYLEMHSKRRYKICICSVILGTLSRVFSKLQGLEYCFSENFR